MEGHKRRRVRRRRPSVPSSVKLGILITVLVLIVVSAGLLMAPALDVDEVYCEGCIITESSEIVVKAQIKTGENILLANLGKSRRLLEADPLIEEASIRRVFPNKICITITERTPVAYAMCGTECAVLDDGGIVLEVIADGRVAEIIEHNTPKERDLTANKPQSEEEIVTDGKTDGQSVEAPEDAEVSTDEVQSKRTREYKVPLFAGLELSSVKEGKIAKADDDGRFEDAMEICGALLNAGLLNRTTYIDITDISDIRIVIENRLDIQIGTLDNIGYRASFLAEVVNTKISAYETAILDYTGDDIYVRPPESNEERTINDGEDDIEEGTDEESGDDGQEE